MGQRSFPFTRELWIEQEDFMETPTKGYHRFTPPSGDQPGARVRLKYGFVVECTGYDKDENGNVTAVHVKYFEDSKSGTPGADNYKVKGNITWVSAAAALEAEVRLYDRLFLDPQPDAGGKDFKAALNPNALETVTAYLEPGMAAAVADQRFQWAGLAAFASKQVGCGLLHSAEIVDARRREREAIDASIGHGSAPGVQYGATMKQLATEMAGSSLARRLGHGNTHVFLDIYPLHRFYMERGWEAFRACLPHRQLARYAVRWDVDRGTLPFAASFPEVLRGFEQIENGRIADSVRTQAQHEQVVRMGVVESVRNVTIVNPESGVGTMGGAALGGLPGDLGEAGGAHRRAEIGPGGIGGDREIGRVRLGSGHGCPARHAGFF